MEAPLRPPLSTDDPREIYAKMNECYLCLKGWEEVRGANGDAEFTKKYYEKINDLFKGKCIPKQAVDEYFALCRSDASGVEGVHRTVERNFLTSIKRAVLYYAETSQFSDWEADSKNIVAALKKQLELSKMLPEMFPSNVLSLLEQDIEEHQDQFSVTYFSCVKRADEDFKETYRQIFAKALSGNGPDGTIMVQESPLVYHSVTCMGNFDLIRAALEKVQLDDSQRTIDNPEIKARIQAFASSFKKVKEIGMECSLGDLNRNIIFCKIVLANKKS